jgi:hypothetical protein
MTPEVAVRLMLVLLALMVVLGVVNFFDSTKTPSLQGDRFYVPFHRDGLEKK